MGIHRKFRVRTKKSNSNTMSKAQVKALNAHVEMLQMQLMQQMKINQMTNAMTKMVGQTGKTMRKGGGSSVGAASHLSVNRTTWKRGYPVSVDGKVKIVRYGIKVEVKDFLESRVKKVVGYVKDREGEGFNSKSMAEVEASEMYKNCEAEFVAFCAANPDFMAECTQAAEIPLPPLADIFKYQIGRQEGIKKVIMKNANAAKAAAKPV